MDINAKPLGIINRIRQWFFYGLRTELEYVTRERDAIRRELSERRAEQAPLGDEILELRSELESSTKHAAYLDGLLQARDSELEAAKAERNTLAVKLAAAEGQRDNWKRKADSVEAVKGMALKADLDSVVKHRDRLLIGWQKSHIAELEVKRLTDELAALTSALEQLSVRTVPALELASRQRKIRAIINTGASEKPARDWYTCERCGQVVYEGKGES